MWPFRRARYQRVVRYLIPFRSTFERKSPRTRSGHPRTIERPAPDEGRQRDTASLLLDQLTHLYQSLVSCCGGVQLSRMSRNDVLVVDSDFWQSQVQLPNPSRMQMYFRLINEDDAVVHGTRVSQTCQVFDNHLLARRGHV